MTQRPDLESITIELPSEETPLAGGTNQACGASYPHDTRVNQAVGNVSTWQPVMPRRGDPDEIGSRAFAEGAAQAARNATATIEGENPALPVRLRQSSFGPKTVGEQSGAVYGVVDPKNRQAVLHLVQRAEYYLAVAQQLASHWANTWKPGYDNYTQMRDGVRMTPAQVEAQIPSWPLGVGRYDAVAPVCADRDAGETVKLVLIFDGDEYAVVDLVCPTEEQRRRHAEDESTLKDLIFAAMLWARCAEEAAHVVCTHYLNEREFKQQQQSRGLTSDGEPLDPVPDPGELPPGPSVPPLPDPVPGEPDPVQEVPPPPRAATSKFTSSPVPSPLGVWWDDLTPVQQALIIGAGVATIGLVLSQGARRR